jgi:hypothetical protein
VAAVLNFRPGNRPTSVDQILDKHRGKGITRDEFKNFHKSFLITMNNFVPDTKTREALNDIFKEVTDYMISESVGPPGEKQKCVDAPDSGNAHPLPGVQTVERRTRRKKTSSE